MATCSIIPMFVVTVAVSFIAMGCVFGASDFKEQCLKAHNKYRAMHGVPQLELSEDVGKVAQEWAENLLQRDVMEHRQPNKYGENIFASFGALVTDPCEKAVAAWYNEIKDYDYNAAKFSFKTGHFTQVVWKGTKKLGCGVAQKGVKTYVVCNYDPPGNWIGAFAQNVPKPI